MRHLRLGDNVSIIPEPRNGKRALTMALVTLAISVPGVISQVEDPVTKALLTVSALALVFVLGLYHEPPNK